ncbi:hypothetical protein [Maridesulfovibrio sp.]|uniref:hypothetical protein n=1 Tax=Maridesulfovibrio sp. TaxID=2795000 RepID=UPI003BAA46E5
MAKRREGARKARSFERKKARAAKSQKSSVLIFGEDQACRELYKLIAHFYPPDKFDSVKPQFGNGGSPVDVIQNAFLYKGNCYNKIVVIMDYDFIESGGLSVDEIIAKAIKRMPNKRSLDKMPDKNDIRVIAVTPNCSECFLLRLTKEGKVSTRKCGDCKDQCILKKIESNDFQKYIGLVDKEQLENLRKQPQFRWINELLAEIQKEPGKMKGS